jgi:hypothetical protein
MVVIDTVEPNTPYLDLLDDTGRHDNDNITKNNKPSFSMTTTDPNVAFSQLLFTDNFKFRVYDRYENSAQEVLIYDSSQDAVADAVLTAGDMFTALTQLTRNLPVLLPGSPGITAAGNFADGVHNLKLEVEDRAGNISHDFLLSITVDTTAPPVSFGLPDAASETDGLTSSSDSGVITTPATFADRITNDTTPRLWGRAEANSIIRVYLDRDNDGVIDLATDTFLGQTVALPYDGNDAYPDGYWELTTAVDLNEIVGLPLDGLRQLLVTAEDVAGNPMPMDNEIADGVDQLDIVLDTQGPRVQDVYVTNFPGYDLFDPKPSTSGFTPLVDRITVKFTDLPARLQDFLYAAVQEDLATTIGNYQLVGDHVGNILIKDILFNDLAAPGGGGGGGGGPAAVAIGSGGVIIDGGDRDDHGHSTAGPDAVLGTADDVNVDGWQFIQQMVAFAASTSQNGGAGILVVGASSTALNAITSVATVLGLPLTVATTGGAVDLATVNFTNFAMMYVPSNDDNTTGGVSTADLATLTTRKVDVQNFVNSGGSLVALTEDGEATPYSWLELPAVFTIGSPSTDNQYQTQALIDAGLVITNGELINGTPLHNTFTGPVGFNGLQPFVFNVGANGVNEDGGGDDEVVTLGLGQGGFIGGSTMAEVILVFDKFLPDDRYTLTVRDSIADAAGNRLDGESQAASPFENSADVFPSGDGVPGGNFTARFTIDSRPEIGSSIAQGIQIDINGNFVWDPANAQIGNDATNVDLAFTLPGYENGALIPGGLSPHDLVVVGKFTAPGAAGLPPRLFDQLASYGNYNGVFRWLIDLDSDGVVYGNGDPDGVDDLIVNQGTLAGFNSTARAGAIPVAGNFDRNAANGDEIGLYYSGIWAVDTDHDYIIDKVITSSLFGAPIVGDFDGNGNDDLAVFNSNQWSFDLSFNALAQSTASSDTSLIWGFPGVLDKPVAADMDQDGIDDIGLWVPRNGPNPPRIIAEWYFLVSGDFDPTPDNGVDNRQRVSGTINMLNHPFSPVPFGFDLFAEFGDELALPIVGNFDPPVSAQPAAEPAATMDGDFTGDSMVDGADFLSWQRNVASQSSTQTAGQLVDWQDNYGAVSSAATTAPTIDGDFTGDSLVDGADLLSWQRNVASHSSSQTAGQLADWQDNYGAAIAAAASGAVAGGESVVYSATALADDVVDPLVRPMPSAAALEVAAPAAVANRDFDFVMLVNRPSVRSSQKLEEPVRDAARHQGRDAALSNWNRRELDRFERRGESYFDDDWKIAMRGEKIGAKRATPEELEELVFAEL